MPQNIQNTHFYMLAFTDNFKEENQNPNGFVRLHKCNAEMHELPERYENKKVFFRVDNITSNILTHNDEIIPFWEEKSAQMISCIKIVTLIFDFKNILNSKDI